MNILFFNPQNPFTTLDAEWELQNNDASDAYQTATALKKDGDFLRGTQYDGKKTISLSFISRITSGNFSMMLNSTEKLVAGMSAVLDSLYYHVDTIQIGYTQTGHPKLDITAHAHLSGKGHGPTSGGGDGGCRIYQPSLKFPALDIGCPNAMMASSATGSSTANSFTAFTLTAESTLSLRSLTYQLKVNHVDELDRIGQHLAGNNYDGTETLNVEFTGEFGTNDFTLGNGWFRDTTGTPRNNTGVNTTSLQLTHHVAHYVPTVGTSAPAPTGDDE